MSSQSIDSHDLPLLHRISSTDANISYETYHNVFGGHDDSCSSHGSPLGSSLNLSFSDIKTKIHFAFADEEETRVSEEERKHHELGQVLALGQRREIINILRNVVECAD
jgi:hypothetical protein